MVAPNQRKAPDFGGYQKSTAVNTSQSDIRSVARAELKTLQRSLRNARGSDNMTRIHFQDAIERINVILDPAYMISKAKN